MATPKMAEKVRRENKETRSSPEKARVQFDFSKESLDKLDEIVETVNASTRAEVIRRALTLYTEVLAAEQRGAKLFFRESDGQLVQLLPLF
jgi:chromosome condensin MukBEF ATPase and DNA-binding subunit MukB